MTMWRIPDWAEAATIPDLVIAIDDQQIFISLERVPLIDVVRLVDELKSAVMVALSRDKEGIA